MNAIIEVLRPRKVKPPLEIRVEALKREVRELKAELREERQHATDMLAIMRTMSHRAIVCECERCTCTPSRSEMLARARRR